MGVWGDISSTSMDWGVGLASTSQSLSRVPLSNLYPQRDLGNVFARIPLSLGGTQGKFFGPCMNKIGTQRRWEQLSCISCAVKMLRKGLCVKPGRSQIKNTVTFQFQFWTCPNTPWRDCEFKKNSNNLPWSIMAWAVAGRCLIFLVFSMKQRSDSLFLQMLISRHSEGLTGLEFWLGEPQKIGDPGSPWAGLCHHLFLHSQAQHHQ